MKRKIERLEHDNNALLELVNQIRSASNDLEVRQIVSLIQSSAPLSEVNNALQQLKQNAAFSQRQVIPLIDDIRFDTERAMSRFLDFRSSSRSSASESPLPTEPASRVLSVTRLVDEPVHQVPSAPWTTVTRDDNLVSHLVSLWVTWYHLLPDGIVLEPFLRAMKTPRRASPFCSPFLVNCILAAACPLSDYDEAKTVRGTASHLMNSFVREAQEHLRQDQSTPSITNVQGLGILYVVISQVNQDRDGYHYAIQAATMGEELSRARERILKSTKDMVERDELAFVLDSACWGVYSATTASISAWMRPQRMAPPPMMSPEAAKSNATFHATSWLPYPRGGAHQNVHLDEVLCRHHKLAAITYLLTHRIYAEREEEVDVSDIAGLHDLYVRLLFWHANLPEYMKQAPSESPSVTMLLIWYHGIVLTLLRAKMRFRKQAQTSSKDVNEDGGEEGEESGDEDDDDGFGGEDANKADQDRLIQHALKVAELCRWHRDAYEYNRLHSFMCQPVCVALYVLIERNGDHQHDAEITELFTAMRAMSRRVPFVFSLLRMIQLDVRFRKFELPPSTEKLFDEYEQLDLGAWMEKGGHNSVYPSPELFVGPYTDQRGDPRATTQPMNMNEFLKLFNKSRIE